MIQFNAYIYFNGECEAAFKFYERALGAKIELLERFGDAPRNPPVSENWKSKIMRGHIRVGDSVVKASDAPPGMYVKPHGTRLSLTINNVKEAEQAFALLSEGGVVHLPFQQTGLSTRFGMLADRYGMPWMINCETPN
jgi:PhnB protein